MTLQILNLDGYKGTAINRKKQLEMLVYLNYKNWIVENKNMKKSEWEK